MKAALPRDYDLHKLAVAHAKGIGPAVLVFGETPPDSSTLGLGYAIIDPDPGWVERARGDGSTSSKRSRFHVRCCGTSPVQAVNTMDLIRDRFLDWRPWPSLRFGAARETDAGPLVADRSVPGDTRWSFTLSYEVDD